MRHFGSRAAVLVFESSINPLVFKLSNSSLVSLHRVESQWTISQIIGKVALQYLTLPINQDVAVKGMLEFLRKQDGFRNPSKL